jgi:hypothetical protein
MTNKISIGSGTLAEFQKAYDEIALKNQGKMWSQLYISGTSTGANSTRNLYEWVIGYEHFVSLPYKQPTFTQTQQIPQQPQAAFRSEL